MSEPGSSAKAHARIFIPDWPTILTSVDMGKGWLDSPAPGNNHKPRALLRCYRSHFMDEKNEVQGGEVPASQTAIGLRLEPLSPDPKAWCTPPCNQGVRNSPPRNSFLGSRRGLLFKSFKKYLLSSDLVPSMVLSQGLSDFCRSSGAPREGPRQGLR